jgi:hypothetical protein
MLISYLFCYQAVVQTENTLHFSVRKIKPHHRLTSRLQSKTPKNQIRGGADPQPLDIRDYYHKFRVFTRRRHVLLFLLRFFGDRHGWVRPSRGQDPFKQVYIHPNHRNHLRKTVGRGYTVGTSTILRILFLS